MPGPARLHVVGALLARELNLQHPGDFCQHLFSTLDWGGSNPKPVCPHDCWAVRERTLTGLGFLPMLRSWLPTAVLPAFTFSG